jgi:hypothetical protein
MTVGATAVLQIRVDLPERRHDAAVRSIRPGDRVVMPFNVAHGVYENGIAGFSAFHLTRRARHGLLGTRTSPRPSGRKLNPA